ncbi:unnamed protein product [Prorocentrum cordatum]|uniref:Uncharacterized protein n=1 Tax=Prorocentrum cordatum TaxID=2364126 RepID=A0ABN9R7Z2_9DINO|nr:unnamed protein product [Polarella glacialis]
MRSPRLGELERRWPGLERVGEEEDEEEVEKERGPRSATDFAPWRGGLEKGNEEWHKQKKTRRPARTSRIGAGAPAPRRSGGWTQRCESHPRPGPLGGPPRCQEAIGGGRAWQKGCVVKHYPV